MSPIVESAVVAFCAIFVVQTLRNFMGRRKIRSDFDYAMQVISREAVKQARREYDTDLDFSADSIEQMEAILAKMHDAHLKAPMSEWELALLSLRWGAYIGEVMKRARPGKWQRDSEGAGPGTIPIVFAPGTEAFPRPWVYKRIADGPEEDVRFKFQVFSDPSLRQNIGQSQQPLT